MSLTTTTTPLRAQDFPLWTQMQGWEMDELLRIVTVSSYSNGDTLFSPQDDLNQLYLLQHGRVKTYTLSASGKVKIMHIFCAGDAFGSLVMGAVDEQLPFAEAVGDVIVCTVDEAGFKTLMQRCPNTCFGLFRYMAEHHVHDMKRIENMLHSKASHRVLYALLALGERLGFEQAAEFSISPHFTHEDIANLIGLRRTTVSEQISALRKRGVLTGFGRNFTVNRAAAEAFLAI